MKTPGTKQCALRRNRDPSVVIQEIEVPAEEIRYVYTGHWLERIYNKLLFSGEIRNSVQQILSGDMN